MDLKKTIRDFDLNNKKVIIRVDFNVPIKEGKITDDNRIKASLETINYAISNGAKVILMSHLGRVKEAADLKKNDLRIVSERLSELLNKEVTFIDATRGPILEEAISNMNQGDVILIQNTRYEDLEGKKESSNDLELGKYWASLGDIFINDAFGTSHRAHASNVGIASNLPNGIGFLIEKELDVLEANIKDPKRPFVVILGGAKVSDKIGVIENLTSIADTILVGGAMAYTFLKAIGINVGSSLVDEESLDFCKEMMDKYSDKIVLPIDSINALEIKEGVSTSETFINDIKPNEIGLDIGHNTLKLFKQHLSEAKLIIWNGTMGYSEIEEFSNGTRGILEIIKELDAIKIIGGGDTGAAVISMGYANYMTHISTGGGASLELLEGKVLPGIDIIGDK